jgi:putative transcriptional regulator
MRETAGGFYSAGLISKRRMGEFDALCHLDVHEMPPKKTKLCGKRHM